MRDAKRVLEWKDWLGRRLRSPDPAIFEVIGKNYEYCHDVLTHTDHLRERLRTLSLVSLRAFVASVILVLLAEFLAANAALGAVGLALYLVIISFAGIVTFRLVQEGFWSPDQLEDLDS